MTLEPIQDWTKHDPIQDWTKHDPIQDWTKHDLIQDNRNVCKFRIHMSQSAQNQRKLCGSGRRGAEDLLGLPCLDNKCKCEIVDPEDPENDTLLGGMPLW